MNKRITIIVGIVIVLIGFGGKLYMDKKAEEKAKEEQRNLLETERESAVALKNKYREIKSIKFDKSSGPDRQTMTGAYHMRVTITNKEQQFVEVNLTYWKESHDIGSIDILNKNVQNNGVTKNKIEIIYTNGSKETI
ncbi:hypothetical protein IGL98_000710 [Enterococcus sp. DIV0840]|uniref:hypothetical protein n=1 Tax=Enterococcus TaxID=1350 RepID=UPI001A8C24B2|nr:MULTISPECIES: hypothetical protein [Enterococcus]MBO0434211.1 hypothetical protein [Enterococcus sp. DIV0849a]MBO0472224.1 hypothetical protein [Enterococcus ureasiticus]